MTRIEARNYRLISTHKISFQARSDGLYEIFSARKRIINEKFLDAIYFKTKKIILVKKTNGNWNLLKTSGAYVSKEDFLEIVDFINGYWLVRRKNGLWNYVDSKGNLLCEAEDFLFANLFYEKLALVQRKNKKWNYVSRKGEFLLPFDCVEAGEFNEGISKIKPNEKWVIINSYGKPIARDHFLNAGMFMNGYIPVQKENNLWNYLSSKGNYLCDEDFLWASNFRTDKVWVQRRNGKWNMIDFNGKFILDEDLNFPN